MAKLSRFNDSLSPSDSDDKPCKGWCRLCRSSSAGLRSTGEHTHFAPAHTSHSLRGGGVAADRRSGVWKSDDESWRLTASVRPLWSRTSLPDRGGLLPGYMRGVLVRSLVGVRRALMGPRVRDDVTCRHAARGSRPQPPGCLHESPLYEAAAVAPAGRRHRAWREARDAKPLQTSLQTQRRRAGARDHRSAAGGGAGVCAAQDWWSS